MDYGSSYEKNIMNFFIKDDSFLTEENKNFINNIVLGDNFPYYISNHSIKDDNKYFLYHVILRRKEDRKENEVFNSSFYPEFLSIIDSFVKKHKIKVKEVLRMSVNYSFNNTYKKVVSSDAYKDEKLYEGARCLSLVAEGCKLAPCRSGLDSIYDYFQSL
jgi:hypothetical protein